VQRQVLFLVQHDYHVLNVGPLFGHVFGFRSDFEVGQTKTILEARIKSDAAAEAAEANTGGHRVNDGDERQDRTKQQTETSSLVELVGNGLKRRSGCARGGLAPLLLEQLPRGIW
jgi:hypothetical protein